MVKYCLESYLQDENAIYDLPKDITAFNQDGTPNEAYNVALKHGKEDFNKEWQKRELSQSEMTLYANYYGGNFTHTLRELNSYAPAVEFDFGNGKTTTWHNNSKLEGDQNKSNSYGNHWTWLTKKTR